MFSERLEKVISLLEHGDTLADIGTDHAYLLTNVIARGFFQKGIGVELNQGPFKSAKEAVEKGDLGKQIEIRLGNGFSPLSPGEVDAAVIAGIGGTVIENILLDNKEITSALKLIVIQPQSSPERVRRALNDLNFEITKEILVKEAGRIYLIMQAKPGEKKKMDWLSLYVGSGLMEERTELFREYINEMIEEREKILSAVEKAKEVRYEKREKIKKEIQLLKGL